MNGAVTVVTFTVSNANAEPLLGQIRARLFRAARDAPGYQGFLVLDQEDGKRMGIVLCDLVESARRVRRIIGPIAHVHVYPHMEMPSIGTLWTVLARDGLFSID